MRDLVLVEPFEPPSKIIRLAHAGSHFAKVVATGPGSRTKEGRAPMHVKVGDTVVYAEAVGEKCHVDGDKVIIVEKDILAVIA